MGYFPRTRIAKFLPRYALALGIVSLAFLFRFALVQGLGLDMPTYITFYPAVITVAVLGGIWPGLIATALCGLGTLFFILSPLYTLKVANLSEAVALVLFSLMGLLISLLAEHYRRGRQAVSDLLDEKALANIQLAASVKALESFSYSVSHDLRAPLRHLDGFLSLLIKRSNAVLDDTSRHYIDRSLEASKRMGLLIDDLLQFSRLGRGEFQRVPVDLNKVVEQVQRAMEPETRDRSIHWIVGRLPVVSADQPMMRQVMENLVTNALKFTRHCPAAEIEIGCKTEATGDAVVFIRDNGAGFDMRYSSKLFQVFQRLHSEQEFEGAGIGLAIVRRVVEQHGGRVWAEGAVGAGATFYFSLPPNGSCTEKGSHEDRPNLAGRG